MILTALYVPGNRPDRFAKATDAGPDLVVLDLEDAVPVLEKVAARKLVVDWIAGHPSLPVEVRVNAIGSSWIADDLRALADAGNERVRVPKVQHRDDIRPILDQLPEARVTCLIESALGLEHAFEIASADPRVSAIGLGEADLSSSLGVDGDDGLAWARGRVVVASRAAGLGAPMMSVYPYPHDLDGLRRSCALGRALGFVGRAAINPRQLPVIASAFTPPPDQVAAATELLATTEVSGGVTVLDDGRMVDPAMLGRAREIVALADL